MAIYSTVFIIIDALDECQMSDDCRDSLLSEIFDFQKQAQANFFATSRFIPEIMEKFKGTTSLEIRATKEDIQKYLGDHISQLPRFVAVALPYNKKLRLKS